MDAELRRFLKDNTAFLDKFDEKKLLQKDDDHTLPGNSISTLSTLT